MSTPQVSRRKDAAHNRARILDAAATVLADDPAASIDAIARAAGLTRRAVYGHFADRDALIGEVIDAGAVRFNAIAEAIDDIDPARALAHLATALWHEAEHVHTAAALALDDRRVERTADALAPVRARLIEICRRGYADRSLRRDISADITARLVEEAARGVITHLDEQHNRDHLLAARAVLSAAGLGWVDVEALLHDRSIAA